MKIVQRFLVCLIFSSFGLAKMFAAAPDELLVSYRFVGATALANNTNAARLKQIWAMPATIELRNDVLQKLSRASVKFFGADAKSEKQTALLRPILDDLIAVESLAELRGAKPQTTFLLAARLNDQRSRLWETNFQQLVKTSKPQPVKIDGATGWQAKAGTNFLKFLRAEKWTIILLGPEQTPTDWLKELRQPTTIASDKDWLKADIDWPRLKSFLPLEKSPFKLARTEFSISAKGGNLRTVARIIYPEKIDWKSEHWRIPKELIHDPLISFSAAQRIAPFLQRQIFPQQIESNPLTNQMFFWAQSQMPFQSYSAFPVKEATNTLKKLGPQLASGFNDKLKRNDAGKLIVFTNNVDWVWQGLPMIAPFLQPAKTNGAEFLVGGLFPFIRNTNPPPAGLFAQISNRNDLVYYDWEITEPRLGQWSILAQLLPIFPKEPMTNAKATNSSQLSPPKRPELKWIVAVAPKLGNTITEVTYKSPTELNVVRSSHIGLNSIELILLSHWLAHPQFPFVNPFTAPIGTNQHSTQLLPPVSKP